MAVTGIKEMAGRTASWNWKRQRSYARKFVVTSNTNYEDPLNVLAVCPSLNASYPTDAYAGCQEIKASQREDMRIWDVEVSYNSVYDQDPANFVENPLSRPVVIDISFEKGTKAVRYDINDVAIDNSANTPIDPPLEVEVSTPVITIKKNKAARSLTELVTLQDVINSDTYLGIGPGKLKLRSVEAPQRQENGVIFYEYTYTIAVKWDGWKAKVLDMGFYELESDGTQTMIRDAYANPLPAPSLLKDGLKLPPGDDPEYLEFQLNREVAFATYLP